MKKNKEIQWLRGVAIIFVLIMHIPVVLFEHQVFFYGGIFNYFHPATGVDLFFVISGFIIGKTFVNQYDSSPDNQNFSLILKFYIRRFYRLYPASVFWISVTLVIGVISRDATLWLTPHELFKKFIASIASVRNFEESMKPSHLGYYWSLSVENQFYFLLPLLLWFTNIKQRIQILSALCFLFIFYRPGGAVWWLFRFDGVLYGLLLYYFSQSRYNIAFSQLFPSSSTGRFLFLTFFLTVILGLPIALFIHQSLAYSMVCWGSMVLVYAASLDKGYIFIPKLLAPVLEWIGERSYSLYLCHIIIFLIIKDILIRLNMQHYFSIPVQSAIGVGAAIICAHLTYLLLERPLQEAGRNKAKQVT